MPSPKLWLARSRRKTGVPRLLRETEFSGGDLTYQLITGIETLQ